MKGIAAFFKNKYVLIAAGILLLLALMYGLYYWGKKAGSTTVQSDTGEITQADKDKSLSIATRLQNDIKGLNFGHDDTIYLELAQSSNTVFALTFAKYKELTGSPLSSDIAGEVFYGWSVIDVILNRATGLNIA